MKRSIRIFGVFLVFLLVPLAMWAQTNVTLWDFLSGGSANGTFRRSPRYADTTMPRTSAASSSAQRT